VFEAFVGVLIMRIPALNLPFVMVAMGLLLIAMALARTNANAEPASVDFPADKSGQTVFLLPSKNIECTYTPAGGTNVYKPFDGGPELSCDRAEPKYIRLVLTPKSIKRFDDVGDQGCCGADNTLGYGMRWSKGPFACESAENGLTCKRADGKGFAVSRARVEMF
jgi:hypothetical protein